MEEKITHDKNRLVREGALHFGHDPNKTNGYHEYPSIAVSHIFKDKRFIHQ